MLETVGTVVGIAVGGVTLIGTAFFIIRRSHAFLRERRFYADHHNEHGVDTDTNDRFLFSGIAEGSEEDVHRFIEDLSKIPGVYKADSTPTVKVGGQYRTRVLTISDRDLRQDISQFGLRRGVVVTITQKRG